MIHNIISIISNSYHDFIISKLSSLFLFMKGVFTGELDPTPITKPGRLKSDDIEIPNVWDLMMNKKPNKRSRR